MDFFQNFLEIFFFFHTPLERGHLYASNDIFLLDSLSSKVWSALINIVFSQNTWCPTKTGLSAKKEQLWFHGIHFWKALGPCNKVYIVAFMVSFFILILGSGGVCISCAKMILKFGDDLLRYWQKCKRLCDFFGTKWPTGSKKNFD